MTTRTSTARSIAVPDVVGVKADEAIQRLRELGLMPITWSSRVEDVKDAGVVLGLDPPADSPVRPKTPVTISVSTHPDFQGHVDDAADGMPVAPVQTPLTWPLSGPTGFAAPPACVAEAPTDVFETAAAPDAASAPASPHLDAAFREPRHDDAAASSASDPASGAAADFYLEDLSAPVPTPGEAAGEDEWDRLRAAEAARHAAGPAPDGDLDTEPTVLQPAVAGEAPADLTVADELEAQARRDARRRSARRNRRLTTKQKAIAGVVLALTLLVAATAMSGRPRPTHRPTTARTAARPSSSAATTPPAARATSHRRAVVHKRAAPHKRRVTVVRKHPHPRPRVVTVVVHTPAPVNPAPNRSQPVASAGPAPSTASPSNTGAGAAPSAGSGSGSSQAAPTPSRSSASSPSSADPHSSGSGGGSTLQSPDGSTAPPQP